MTTIEESKDLNEIKVQELISSLQTYELTLLSQRKSKSLALKTINERIEAQDSSEEDDVEKEVAFLAKNFPSFLNSKKMGSPLRKENSLISRKTRRNSKRRIPKTLLLLKQSIAMSATGMVM